MCCVQIEKTCFIQFLYIKMVMLFTLLENHIMDTIGTKFLHLMGLLQFGRLEAMATREIGKYQIPDCGN